MTASSASTALLLTRLAHTLIWAVMAAAIVALPFLARARRFSAALAIAVLIVVEGITLAAFGGACRSRASRRGSPRIGESARRV